MQSIQDGCDHPIQVGYYKVVPESEHAVSLGSKMLRPLQILLFLLQMGASIQFEDEMVSRRAEVGDIGADRVLPAKYDST